MIVLMLPALTYFSNHLIIFQDPPGDINAIIIPVCARHTVIDIGIDARHDDGGSQGAVGLAHNRYQIERRGRRAVS